MPTKIEWTDETINPIVGCSKISEGCQNCYAEKMAWRLKCMGIQKYQDVVDENGWNRKIGIDMSVFNALPKTPKKIFVGSMGDLFHENLRRKTGYGTEWERVYQVFDMMFKIPQHTYLLLTKRPDNMNSFYKEWILPSDKMDNIWLGVTVEHPDYLWRIDELLKIPAAVRFVSIEPMLEKIDLPLRCPECGYSRKDECIHLDHYLCDGKIPQIDWCICGPETGPGKRECKPEWIRDLYEQCRAAGVPFFDKTKKNWIAREFPK